MNCNQVKPKIPQWMDGELKAGEAELIAAHVENCANCRSEVDFWREVGTVLREDFVDIKAPPGFTGRVMSQLAGDQRTALERFISGWKRNLAVAATFLLVAAGSVGAYMHMGGNTVGQVATDDGNQTGYITVQEPDPEPNNDNNTGDTGTPGNLPAEQDEQNNTGASDNTGTKPAGSEQEANTEEQVSSGQQSSGSDNNDNEQTDTTQAGADTASPLEDTSEQYALLSVDQDRFIESTLVRVKVEDLNTAREQALSLVKTFGARYEVLGSESTAGGGQETLKVIVDSNLSDKLQQEFTKLGQVIATDTQRDDLSSKYNEKVEQYRSLEAQLQAAGTAEEKNQLQIKMAAIKEQLKAWNRETEADTIILWLEN